MTERPISAVTARSYEPLTDQERGALALWRAWSGREPIEPLRVKGGALDPDAWCMEASAAALAREEVPRIVKDQPAPTWVRFVVHEAVDPDYDPDTEGGMAT